MIFLKASIVLSSDEILIEIKMVDKIRKIIKVSSVLIFLCTCRFVVHNVYWFHGGMYGLVYSLYVIFYGKLYGKYLIWTDISLLLLLEYISGAVFVSLSKTLVCNCSKRSINTCGILILLQICSSVWNTGFCSYLVTMHAR